MFPLRDENPTEIVPFVTLSLIAATCGAWWFLQGAGLSIPTLEASVCAYGAIPAEVTGRPAGGGASPCSFGGLTWEAVPASMFMHGGWMHLIGNMWFLWVFGDNVEDEMGPLRFVFFYVLCGLGAAAAQIVTDPDSVIPMVGASGAIGGVMGAYALLFPRVRVNLLLILGFYVTTIAVPAIFMLGYWFLLQLLQGIPALGSEQGGVAFWAHVGGFVAGLVLVLLFRRPGRGGPPGPRVRRPHTEDPRSRWF